LERGVQILISGANGHIGRRLIERLAPRHRVTALVRSVAARDVLLGRQPAAHVDVAVVDYQDRAAVRRAAEGCTALIHLVGILKEGSGSRYVAAHEGATAALLDVARALRFQRIVYLSILGAHPGSRNACLASKGRAEQLLLDSGIATLILRVPMVLGEGDHASRALARSVAGRLSLVLRGASLEQPIYADDVVAAIVAGVQHQDGNAVLDLAGPESLPRRQLLQRAARACGRAAPRCVSLPLAPLLPLADAVEWLARCLGRDPPVTRAMLEVLDHDDHIDPGPAAAALGIRLTALDDMLRRCIGVPHVNGTHSDGDEEA
jgi:uncharacterized protein YbjT (DUF2867 family)